MNIGTRFLSEPEKQLFIDILFKYEGAIAFDDSEMGLLRPEIEPPVVIHTIPHIPWQQQNIRLPYAMKEAAIKIVKEKLTYGLLEFSQGPYRSLFFLVKKKNGEWRLINDVQPLNGVIIRDSGLPPSVDEFSEDFAGYPITWADRISVRRSTGYSAFELVYGRECLLPVQISIISWCIVDWEGEVKTREDLLVARIRQLDQRALDEARAAENLERSRKENKDYFDEHKRLRGDGNWQLHVGDLVLLHTGKRQQSRVLKEKLDDYWHRPYRIRQIPENSTFYYLEEFDGTLLAKTIMGNRLKKFFSWMSLDEG